LKPGSSSSFSSLPLIGIGRNRYFPAQGRASFCVDAGAFSSDDRMGRGYSGGGAWFKPSAAFLWPSLVASTNFSDPALGLMVGADLRGGC